MQRTIKDKNTEYNIYFITQNNKTLHKTILHGIHKTDVSSNGNLKAHLHLYNIGITWINKLYGLPSQ